MQLMLPELPADRAKKLAEAIEDPKQFGARFPVPSVSMAEPSFVPGYLEKLVWRGPTWNNTNWYIARGLRRHGFETLAVRVEDASVDLIEKSGFREYYNPETGEGFGAPDFSWSAVALDSLAAREST